MYNFVFLSGVVVRYVEQVAYSVDVYSVFIASCVTGCKNYYVALYDTTKTALTI
jgi:hypothetical protein